MRKRKLDYNARIPDEAWPMARKTIELTWNTCREHQIDGDLAAIAFSAQEALYRLDEALAALEKIEKGPDTWAAAVASDVLRKLVITESRTPKGSKA